ncbi:MAG: glycoside hydrolase family 88 protein, partial [Spirochaetaceae bacterium]|nr:glycoside hydrolase family 88 protein [Spirochaetaceae bacterium]
WEWPQGVALYALYRRYEAKGEAGDLAFIRSWFDRSFERPLPVRNVNTTAPLLSLACLLGREDDRALRAFCSGWADWAMRDMPRTEEGGIQHVTSHLANPGELWADTLFMTVLFLARAGILLGRPELVQEAAYQFLLHIRYLADPESGLWFHGWSFEGRHHFGKAHWARGNAWFAMAAIEFLEMLGVGDADDVGGAAARCVREAFLSQARTLARFQAKDGLWHTIIDDPSSYTETSASAGFAYAWLKAIRLGVMDGEFRPAAALAAERAARGVVARIDERGFVGGVSHGTAVGWDAEHYRSIRVAPTAYGQGLAFLMLTEYEGD